LRFFWIERGDHVVIYDSITAFKPIDEPRGAIDGREKNWIRI
jgi:hypothetical protein